MDELYAQCTFQLRRCQDGRESVVRITGGTNVQDQINRRVLLRGLLGQPYRPEDSRSVSESRTYDERVDLIEYPRDPDVASQGVQDSLAHHRQQRRALRDASPDHHQLRRQGTDEAGHSEAQVPGFERPGRMPVGQALPGVAPTFFDGRPGRHS